MRAITSLGKLRPLTMVVLLVMVCVTVAATFGMRAVAADQQRRLLHDKTTEAGYVVESIFSAETQALVSLGGAVESAQRFAAAAATLQSGDPIGALRHQGGSFVVAYSVGSIAPGRVVGGQLASLAQRALAVKGAVSGVVSGPGRAELVFAERAGSNMVVYLDTSQFQPRTVLPAQATGPFSQLNGVIYASDHPNSAATVLTTTLRLPLGGHVDRQSIPIGADQWTLETSSRGSLVGAITADAPWAILAGGLIAALLVAVLAETLSRRRVFAETLVDERTAALRTALAERSQLEQAERRARELAEAASLSKNEFLSRMSHELRTPLNAVLGFGQLLELDDLAKPQRESVDQILKAGRHLLELINDVLDIARIESGRLSLSPEPVNVAELIHDILDLLRPVAAQKQIAVESDVEHQCHVQADRQRLKQVMLNLVSNAIKYNRPGGSVRISCTPADAGRARVVVADTGPGISSEDLERLFVPFERLGAERTEVEGTGIGLALSQHLVQAMEGTIGVNSTPGHGSQFWVELPASTDPVTALEPSVDTPGVDHREGDRRCKVLHIEDNLSNLTLIERILQRRGAVDVIAAMQGRLGITLARENRPDLILLDLHLPDLNGAEVLNELKGDPLTASIPIIVVSADATAGQIQRLLAQGATAYLTKPLDVEQLLALVDSQIAASAIDI